MNIWSIIFLCVFLVPKVFESSKCLCFSPVPLSAGLAEVRPLLGSPSTGDLSPSDGLSVRVVCGWLGGCLNQNTCGVFVLWKMFEVHFGWLHDHVYPKFASQSGGSCHPS